MRLRDDLPRAQFVELFTNRDEKPTEGETTILQALALMNGALMSSVTSVETSETLAAVADAPFLDTAGRIESLFLAALTRRPRPDELERLVPYVDAAAPQATRRRRSPTSSGPCLTAPSSGSTTDRVLITITKSGGLDPMYFRGLLVFLPSPSAFRWFLLHHEVRGSTDSAREVTP